MRLRDQIRLAWRVLRHKEIQDAIEASFQNMVDVMNFQKITGRRLSEANLAITRGEIEIKGAGRMTDAIEWADGYGRSHWQPLTENGESLWLASNYADGMHRSWRAQAQESSALVTFHGPVTYRSRARAERVARRRQSRQEAKKLSRMHPVQKKEQDA